MSTDDQDPDAGEGGAPPNPNEEVLIWGSERSVAPPNPTPAALRTPAYDVRRPPTRRGRRPSRRHRSRRSRRRRSRSRGTRRPRVSLVRRAQRAWHEHPLRTRFVLLSACVAIAALAVLSDAYWQTYRTYADMRQAIPKIEQAKSSLVRGKIPPPEVFDAVTAAASRATYDVQHTDFAFRLVGSIPMLNRPIEAVRWAARAADQESQAVTDLRDLIRDVLGDRALESGNVEKSTLPIYRDGAINVALLDSLAPRLTRLLGHLQA